MAKSLDYSTEPSRQQLELIVRKDKPFNAEPSLPNLVQHSITPVNKFFCRSHGPLPCLDDTHTITIDGIGLKNKVYYTVKQLKDMFKERTIEMAMQCAGNRRDGLHKVKHTKGVIWGPGAIGNAVYTGCRLKDVLDHANADFNSQDIGRLHVAFESMEECEEERCYGSSIPLTKAIDELGDVLLAYKMNGEPLTQDHGAPIRVVVPGYIGARSVKFLKSMTIQTEESESYFQRKDYKILPGEVVTEQDAANYWNKVPSISEYNVQSYVCDPSDGLVDPSCRETVARGYALSGGGRGIQRVEVSGDDGKTWTVATFIHRPEKSPFTNNVWGWCLWEAKINVKRNTRIVCRALDTAGNIQQENPIWNYRGVMNNAWRTIDREKPENANL
ncbi:Oxidoreductase, molybdopterin-binding domain-containing protein, partial [Chlamydoabsidia padenii]